MAKDEASMERAQLVRVFEAACKIDYPTAEEANFRIAVMKKIGLAYNLKEVRNATVDGPVKEDAKRPGRTR